MPGIMFQDVVSSRIRSHRKWYTLPLSFVVHTFVLAVLIVVPLIATDLLPRPRAMHAVRDAVRPCRTFAAADAPCGVVARPRGAQEERPSVAPDHDRR